MQCFQTKPCTCKLQLDFSSSFVWEFVCNSRTREKAEHIGKRDVSYTASGTALCVENTHCVLQVHLRCKCLTNTLLLYDCILTAVNLKKMF